MILINKWNHSKYTLVLDKGSSVVLRRADGTEFTISKQEYKANYREVKDE